MFVFAERLNFADDISIKSYSYMNLLLGYGPKKEVTCKIYWSIQSQGFRLTFVGGISAVNAHSMMREQLAFHLNRQHNLIQIVQILHDTYQPLSSIAKLPIIPQLATTVSLSFIAMKSFVLIKIFHFLAS